MKLKELLSKVSRKPWQCVEEIKALLELYHMDNGGDLEKTIVSTVSHLNGIVAIDVQGYGKAQQYLTKLYYSLYFEEV